jgi:outer membrane protein assembly factor BamB
LTTVNASTGELVWQSDTGGPTGSVRVIAGVAYVGCRDGNATPLSAFDAATGELLWRREGGCVFPPAVVDGVGYSGGEPGDLLAFDTSDGSEVWHAVAAAGVSQAPVVAGGIVYVVTNDVDAVFAYDAATGEQLWRYDVYTSSAAPAVAGGRLYTTDAGDVFAIGGSDQFPAADAAPESTAATTTASVPED